MQADEHNTLRKIICETLDDSSTCEEWLEYYMKRAAIAHNNLAKVKEIWKDYIKEFDELDKEYLFNTR